MVMMNSSSSGPNNEPSISKDPLTIPAPPSWNFLYDNPCYNRYSHPHQLQPLHRRFSKSFRDLTGCKSIMMDLPDVDRARTRTTELKAELELERKARRKVESANKKLVKELCKEKKERAELESDCGVLVKELAVMKLEMDRLRVEIEDERKMMKMVEVLREERVQMKLAEAKLIYEEKYEKKSTVEDAASPAGKSSGWQRKSIRTLMGEKSVNNCSNDVTVFASVETENPHIKHGIKGFVEFPKVVRAIGSKNKNLLGSKLENQAAQIRILLKQKSVLSPSQSSKLLVTS